MPPKTNAERQKAYRERLKRENPTKYEEIRIKHLEKVKKNIKKKNDILTEAEKEELREKWRQGNAKRAARKKQANPTTKSTTRKETKNNTKILKKRLQKLTEENNQLKKENKNLRQAFNRITKEQLDSHISHGNDITNTKEAYDYLMVHSKVKMFYIDKKDIQKLTKSIPENIIPIKGTIKLHQIITDGNPTINNKFLSCFDCHKNVCCNCCSTKGHELLSNSLTEPKASCSKQQALKKHKPPGKRFKRTNSSTTTESDVISYHSDSDSIHAEFLNEDLL